MVNKKSILIIYTGGTIGSIQDPKTGSLVPIDFNQITTHVPELNRAGLSINAVSFNPPIDSSNVNPSHWRKIANLISSHHDEYDGFVILHGTDTMAFTASALSFMIDGLKKPVILTGSQLPIGMPRTDGRENLLASVMLAAHENHSTGNPSIQEVSIYFGNQLLRGNRAHKESTQSFNAIVSPNYPPLVEAGVDFKFNHNAILKPSKRDLKVNTRFESKVAWLPIFPGMSIEVLEKILEWESLRGLVLGTYGSGNAPESDAIKSLLLNANERGVIILNVTQCSHGGVHHEKYATSLMLSDCGVISGGDMTNEAALTKLMMLLGTTDDMDLIRRALLSGLRGERTV